MRPEAVKNSCLGTSRSSPDDGDSAPTLFMSGLIHKRKETLRTRNESVCEVIKIVESVVF